MQTIANWYSATMIRVGWYKYRKADGHPISMFRALFGKYPRFGAYEDHEQGCEAWVQRDYDLVRK